MIVVVLDEYAFGFDLCARNFPGWLFVWAVWQALVRGSHLRRLLSGVRLTKLLG